MLWIDGPFGAWILLMAFIGLPVIMWEDGHPGTFSRPLIIFFAVCYVLEFLFMGCRVVFGNKQNAPKKED